jgi:hypothetical protein
MWCLWQAVCLFPSNFTELPAVYTLQIITQVTTNYVKFETDISAYEQGHAFGVSAVNVFNFALVRISARIGVF